jgi:hypothetical protein
MAAFYTREEHRQYGRLLHEGGTPTIWPPFTRGRNTDNMAAFYNRTELRSYTAPKDLVAVYCERENGGHGRLLDKDRTKRVCPQFTRGWYTIEIAISSDLIIGGSRSGTKNSPCSLLFTALVKGLF